MRKMTFLCSAILVTLLALHSDLVAARDGPQNASTSNIAIVSAYDQHNIGLSAALTNETTVQAVTTAHSGAFTEGVASSAQLAPAALASQTNKLSQLRLGRSAADTPNYLVQFAILKTDVTFGRAGQLRV